MRRGGHARAQTGGGTGTSWFSLNALFFSATNAACNIYSNVAYKISGNWYQTDRHKRQKSVTAGFSVEILGLALVAELSHEQPRILKKVGNSQAFPDIERNFFFSICFVHEPVPGTPRQSVMSVEVFALKFEELTAYDCVGSISSHT